MRKFICVLCGKETEGWGNNPDPLAEKGQCCKDCDITRVIPARIEEMYRHAGVGRGKQK